MPRTCVDCRDYPRASKGTVAMSADSEEELLEVAAQHALSVHGAKDRPQFRQERKSASKEGRPRGQRRDDIWVDAPRTRTRWARGIVSHCVRVPATASERPRLEEPADRSGIAVFRGTRLRCRAREPRQGCRISGDGIPRRCAAPPPGCPPQRALA
jgi:hypothetical protein